MLRRNALALMFVATLGTASAQDGNPADIDFLFRPTQGLDGDAFEEDIWDWEQEPEVSLLESEIGPPLLGPEEIEEDAVERRTRREDADPFAPIGVNVGPFVIRPAIEIGIAATDNVSGGTDKEAAVGLVLAPDISMRSEDERHEFEALVRGEAIFYEEEEFDELSGEARARLRYDLAARTSLYSEAYYTQFLEDFTDPDTPDAAAERPAVRAFGGSLGVEKRFGRIAALGSAFVERSLHEDVPLAGGGTASREELDDTEYGVRLRTTYGTDRSLAPFTEVALGRRDMDQEVDDSGFERSALWGELRGGLVIDRGAKLSGEISAGYRHEDLEDGRLEDMDVFLANAAILWSPRRLTEVRFDLGTDTMTTSVPDVSGSVLYGGTLTVTQRLTSRISAEGGAGLSYERPIGDDWDEWTIAGFAGATYSFNRTAALHARYVYERSESSESGEDTDEHEVSLRIRLQR